MTSVEGVGGCSGPLTTLLVSAGGKGSGIFDESGPMQTRPRLNPPGGKTSDIFGSPVAAASPTAHPNKPKDPEPVPHPDKSQASLAVREKQPGSRSLRLPSTATNPGWDPGLAPTTKS